MSTALAVPQHPRCTECRSQRLKPVQAFTRESPGLWLCRLYLQCSDCQHRMLVAEYHTVYGEVPA